MRSETKNHLSQCGRTPTPFPLIPAPPQGRPGLFAASASTTHAARLWVPPVGRFLFFLFFPSLFTFSHFPLLILRKPGRRGQRVVPCSHFLFFCGHLTPVRIAHCCAPPRQDRFPRRIPPLSSAVICSNCSPSSSRRRAKSPILPTALPVAKATLP